MIYANYTIKCERCGEEVSGRYEADGYSLEELETVKQFIGDSYYGLAKFGGEEKLLCAGCVRDIF
ncbi:MAG: hypothetical protein LBQ88_07230 [Treponema sp.]|jgi:hypothetical protein|nr:hypothetical protein [Treponema sp.]